MNTTPYRYFLCPACGGNNLAFSSQETGVESVLKENEMKNGTLICQDCRDSFEVRNGIPRFVKTEDYSASFGYQWNIHAITQLDSKTGLPLSSDRLFRTSGWPRKMKGQRILEAGCGAGRFTEVLLNTDAFVFSFDYSCAVDVNGFNNGNNPNLVLFQADIIQIPLPQSYFDRVLCIGVLQHTPDPEKSFKSLVNYVRPGGELVIDCYAKRLKALIQWKYILRPITKRMKKERLYKLVSFMVSLLLPLAILLRRLAGGLGARLLPIVQYSHWGLPYKLNKQWAILDTFDMYSPAYDKPQSLKTVNRWFKEAGFDDYEVFYGDNGVCGRGRVPN